MQQLYTWSSDFDEFFNQFKARGPDWYKNFSARNRTALMDARSQISVSTTQSGDSQFELIFLVEELGIANLDYVEDGLYCRLTVLHNELVDWSQKHHLPFQMQQDFKKIYSEASIGQAYRQIMTFGQRVQSMAFKLTLEFSASVGEIPKDRQAWGALHAASFTAGELDEQGNFKGFQVAEHAGQDPALKTSLH